jgi:hypothetical protein
MSGAFDKYLGIVLIALVLFYFFRNAQATESIIKSLSSFNVSAISALQGSNANTPVSTF